MRKDPIYIPLLALLATFASVVSAHAAQIEPLPPREAYRYAVTDTGDALEVDWAIEDGYYLYRNKPVINQILTGDKHHGADESSWCLSPVSI